SPIAGGIVIAVARPIVALLGGYPHSGIEPKTDQPFLLLGSVQLINMVDVDRDRANFLGRHPLQIAPDTDDGRIAFHQRDLLRLPIEAVASKTGERFNHVLASRRSVVPRRQPFAPEIIHEGAHEHQSGSHANCSAMAVSRRTRFANVSGLPGCSRRLSAASAS